MRCLLIFVGIVAADAMFDDPMIHPQMKREMLQPRQTLPNLSPSCTSALLGIYSSIPTPPARLVTAIGADNGNPCSATVPSSLSSEFSDYQNSVGSWYSSSSNDVSSALSNCPELSRLATLLPVCVTSYLDGGVASGSGTDTTSGAGNTDASSTTGGDANSQTTDTSSAASTRTSATGTDAGAASAESGFVVALLAAAGAIAAAL